MPAAASIGTPSPRAVSWIWRYFLLGAVIVVPIWLIARLVKSGSRTN